MNLRIGITMLVLGSALTAEASTIVRVTGQVVDAAGKPVAGASVAEYWISEQGGPLKSERPAVAGSDRRFSLEIELFRFDQALMAFDPTGPPGVATIGIKSPQQPISVKLLPLGRIRTHTVHVGKLRRAPVGVVSDPASAAEQAPAAGQGRPRAWPSICNCRPAGIPCRRRGPATTTRWIRRGDCRAREIGRSRRNQVDPLAKSAALRQAGASVALCGGAGRSRKKRPAQGLQGQVGWRWSFGGLLVWTVHVDGLPGWMDFADDHAIDRDKFYIVTVHERNVTDFADLDKKLKPIVARVLARPSVPVSDPARHERLDGPGLRRARLSDRGADRPGGPRG